MLVLPVTETMRPQPEWQCREQWNLLGLLMNSCRESRLLINAHESFSISPLSQQGLFLFTSLIVRFPFNLLVRTQGGDPWGKESES